MSYSAPLASATNYGVVQVGSGLSVTNGLLSAGTGLLNYGFFSNGTQTNPVANTLNIVTFSITGPANGVNIVSGTNLTVQNAGVYNTVFTANVAKTSGGTSSVSIWLRLNGVNVVGSRQELELTNTLATTFVTGNFTLTIPTNGYLQVAWSSSDTTVALTALPAAINPIRPTGDSIKITLTRIS